MIWLSVVTSILVTVTSVCGLANTATYSQETNNWALQAVGQDIANLLVVFVLVLSTYFLSKSSLRAYFVWLGCYIYLFYAFVIYTFFIHFNYLFLLYIAVLGLSFYIPVGSLLTTNFSSLSKVFTSRIRVKPASVLLMIIAILFYFLWLSEIIPSLFFGKKPQGLIETALWVNPVHVLDLGLLLPGMIITSLLLWWRKFLGYFLAVPLLVFSATMGSGIVILFALFALENNTTIAAPVYIMVAIVLTSICLTYQFLIGVKEN